MSDTVTTITTSLMFVPEHLRQVSTCPKCGAPIYVDADLGTEIIDALPTPFFTCSCRYATATTIPLYLPTPYPYPSNTPEQWVVTPYPYPVQTIVQSPTSGSNV